MAQLTAIPLLRRLLLFPLALACPIGAAALELSRGDWLDQPYDLRGYARIEEDVRLSAHTDEPATTEPSRLRRARLGLALRWQGDWVAHVSGDFARRPKLRDLRVEYRGWPVRIEAGRMPEPFGLGESVSSTDTLLTTLPSPSILGPGYGFGIGFNWSGRNWGLAGGSFTSGAGRALSGRYSEDAQTLRATWRPWVGESGYVHLGASGSLRQPRAGSGVQLFGSAESPLTHRLSPKSVLLPDAERYRLVGGESVARLGPVMLLAEAVQAQVADGGPEWHGHYLEVGWCLTGEQRSYSTRYGTIGGISPDRPVELGGYGAWELAARWSDTDLSDGGGDHGRVRSAALNWYPTDDLRVSVSVHRSHLQPTDQPARDGTVTQLQLQLSL